MKPGSVLALSLLANAALAAAWFSLPGRTAPAGAAPEIPAAATPHLAPRRTTGPRETTLVVSNHLPHDFQWSRVESADYKIYIANLRAIGCPEDTVRDIIIADVTKLYAPRLLALQKPAQDKKFWEADQDEIEAPADRDRAKQLQALATEKEALLKELLDIRSNGELRTATTGMDWMEQRYDYLPEAKRKAVREVFEKFEKEESEFYARVGDRWNEEDTAARRKMQKRKEAEIAKALTPEEYLQYQLRSSDIANNLRRTTLDGFKPSEQEFIAVFKLKQLEADRPEDRTQEAQAAYTKSLQDGKNALKEALGPDRYAEYERNLNYDYRQAAKLTERLGLAQDTPQKLVDMRATAETAAKAIRADRSLSQDQKTAALTAIQNETRKSIAEQLGGDKNYKSWRRQGGSWISNLAPPPPDP